MLHDSNFLFDQTSAQGAVFWPLDRHIFFVPGYGRKKTRGCVARHTILAMVWKLGQSAQKKWRKLRGFKLLGEVIRGVQFKDGEQIDPLNADELNSAVI